MKTFYRVAILIGIVLMIAFAQAEEQPETLHVEIGSIVRFGRYEQDGNPDNGPERIEWIVLDEQEGKCLLLSRYCLDAQPYQSKNGNTTWKDCSLRKWLNSDFLNTAFFDMEQELIPETVVDNSKKQGYGKWKKTKGGKNTKDKVFLLSCAEAKEYLGVVFNGPLNPPAQAEATAYAAGKGAYCETVHEANDTVAVYSWWWLRSPGYVQNAAAGVGGHGTLLDSSAIWEEACVRPAIWVKLDEYAAVFLEQLPRIERKTSGDYTYTVLEDGSAEIIRYSGKDEIVVIPGELDGHPVSAVGEEAFIYCSYLASVTIPDGVTVIGDYAFYACDGLVSAVLPGSVETIGNTAFGNCSSLPSVTLPDGVKTIESYAFFGCRGLTSVVIPKSVETIGNSAFADCSGLTSVTIPAGVKYLGEFVFNSCKGLTSVTLEDGCAAIPDFMFSDCSSLASIKIPDSVRSIGIRAFWGCSSLASVVIPEGVAAVGSEAFGVCESLVSVTISDSVEAVGSNPFTSCGALKEIRISGNHPYLNMLDGVLFSKPDHRLICFTKAFAEEAYAVPDGTLEIGERAFWDCDTLTSIALPDSVTTIGDETFGYCVNLRSARIPGSVTVIGVNAFYACPRELKVKVDRGSSAEQYCKESKLKRSY